MKKTTKRARPIKPPKPKPPRPPKPPVQITAFQPNAFSKSFQV